MGLKWHDVVDGLIVLWGWVYVGSLASEVRMNDFGGLVVAMHPCVLL